MNKPVFYDPQRKRWKRLRRVFDAAAVVGAFLLVVFIIGLLQIKPLPELRLTSQTRNYKALTSPPKPAPDAQRPASPVDASQDPDQAVRHCPEQRRNPCAPPYYVDWDPSSYSSLKQHIKQIDLLFPEWLHVITPDGGLIAFSAEDNRPFPVVDKSGVRHVDQENKVARAIADNHVDTENIPARQ